MEKNRWMEKTRMKKHEEKKGRDVSSEKRWTKMHERASTDGGAVEKFSSCDILTRY